MADVDRLGEKITCLQFDNNKLVTGSSDAKIKVWDVKEATEMYSLPPEDKNVGWVRCLQFDEDMLISGHGDGSIRIKKFKK